MTYSYCDLFFYKQKIDFLYSTFIIFGRNFQESWRLVAPELVCKEKKSRKESEKA